MANVALRPETIDETEGTSISDLIRVLQRFWFLVVAFPIICFFLASLYLRFATYSYTATMQVTPVASTNSPTSMLRNNLGGLASIAGLDIGGSDNVSFDLYLNGLTSHLAAESLADDAQLMHAIFAGEWSNSDQSWHEPNSMVTPAKNAIKRILGIPIYSWKAPNADSMEDFLSTSLKVSKDRQTQIATISLSLSDPEQARNVLTKLHGTVDGILRKRTLERTTNAIAYLTEKLQSNTIAKYRQAVVQTLSDQEKLKMMASSNLPFAAEPFGPPTVSPLPTSPKPTIILALSLMSGLFFGCLSGLFLDRIKQRN